MKELELVERAERLLSLPAAEAERQLGQLPLERQRELALSLPPGKKRMELLLLSPQAAELVPTLSPEDFALTIKTVGEVDALELLALSSDEQTTYLADLELWREDRLDLSRLAWWNEILLRCGHERFGRWLEKLDFEILELFFERSLRLVEREQVPDLPDDQAERLVTPDNYHYFVVQPPADPDLVKKLLDELFAEHRELFLALCGNLGTNPPAEVEEQALRWRLGRLADRGWPDPEEALAVYQPRPPEQIKPSFLPAGWENPPRYPLQPAFAGDLLAAAASRLNDPARLASQLANLTNRVLLADHLLLSEPESLRQAAQRVRGRVQVGLGALGATDVAGAVSILESVPLLHLFQLAEHHIRQRRKRVQNLLAQTPPRWQELLDPPLDEVLEALLEQRPLYFDARSGLRREFEKMEDLLAMDRQLDLLQAFAELSGALDLAPEKLPSPFPAGYFPESLEGLHWTTLFLTTFARQCLGLPPAAEPLDLDTLPSFLNDLPAGENQLKNILLGWLSGFLDPEQPGPTALVSILSSLLGQLRELQGREIDARFVGHLWLRRKQKSK